jgi:uncharacterized sulfatase
MAGKQVVIVTADTQRRDMLGCYCGKEVKTPNLDRLASEGMLFERAYCADPVCTPARSAIFTGTYPHTNGAWSNGQAMGANIANVAQRLSQCGIHCVHIGKWHLDGGSYGYGVAPPGWDPEWWFDNRNYIESLPEHQRPIVRSPNGIGKVTPDMCFAHQNTERALTFLEQTADDDFLLVVEYEEPHHPWMAPEPFASAFDDVDVTLDDDAFIEQDTKRPELHRLWAEHYRSKIPDSFVHTKRRFLACNTYLDHEIGRLLEGIEARCPAALVIYTADHGFSMGNRGGMYDKGPSSCEEITGIPLICRCRGLIAPGTRYAEPASHIDLVPTVLDYMGCEISPALAGRSMMPILEDPAAAFSPETFIEYGRFTTPHDGFGGFQPYRACVTRRYKLCINLLDKDELYDLENDPAELDNLIESPAYEEIRNELHDRILTWMNRTRDPFRGYHWERRPWRKDAAPASYHYGGSKRETPGDPGFFPPALDYNTGLPIKGDFNQTHGVR